MRCESIQFNESTQTDNFEREVDECVNKDVIENEWHSNQNEENKLKERKVGWKLCI